MKLSYLWRLLALIVLVGACVRPPAPPVATPKASPTAKPPLTPVVRRAKTSPRSLVTPTARPAATPRPATYTVQPGDTLALIATRFDTSVEELMRLNGLTNPDLIYVGQVLRLPDNQPDATAPPLHLVPDSEAVYGPGYRTFSVAAAVRQQGGYLASYSEVVDGRELTGIEIVERVARQFSVGPRVLLAIMEVQSGWLTQAEPHTSYAFGLPDPQRDTLFLQTSWAANRLNQAYYAQAAGRDPFMTFADGTRWASHPATNPGSAAVANVIAQTTDPETWRVRALEAFPATYHRLFGDPWAKDIPLVPPSLEQPYLSLPWPRGEGWYFTGGPHPGWGTFGSWAALDFTPPDVSSCWPSSTWAVAAAPGLVVHSYEGEVIIDLDGDGFVGTGWTLLYLHMAKAGRVKEGTWVQRGTPVGHPSCEGGFADAAHLHIARRYNGVWMGAEGPVPFALSMWEAVPANHPYDGWLVRGEERREACACRAESNLLVADE